MKNLMIKFTIALVVLTFCGASVLAGEPSEGLDLFALAEMLKNSDNLEKFEQTLNNTETGINNLDLNEDDAVDFISVTEQVADDTHLVVLQTPLGENEFQDLATIAVEKQSGENYNLQIQGNETIYGENYYVVPANNNFSLWNVVKWIFRPNYRAYVSPFNFRNHPRWWTARRPVALNVYRSRAGAFVGRRNFVASRTVTVKTINKVNYRPRTLTLVRKTKVTRTTTTTNARPNTVVRPRTENTVRPERPAQTPARPNGKNGVPKKKKN